MVAEDYRQLFGTANARSGNQVNRDLPPATDVPGLADYLSTTFRTSPVAADEPAPAALDVGGLSVSVNSKSSYTVAFGLSVQADVTVSIQDGRGRLVKNLVRDATKPAGTVGQSWDRTDSQGRAVKRGTYVAVVDAAADAQAVQRSVAFKVS